MSSCAKELCTWQDIARLWQLVDAARVLIRVDHVASVPSVGERR